MYRFPKCITYELQSFQKVETKPNLQLRNDFSNILPRMRTNAESNANLKETKIDILRITKCLCDQKPVLISFSELIRKN